MKAEKIRRVVNKINNAIIITPIIAALLGGIFGAILSAGSMSRIDNISIVAICSILAVQLIAFETYKYLLLDRIDGR